MVIHYLGDSKWNWRNWRKWSDVPPRHCLLGKTYVVLTWVRMSSWPTMCSRVLVRWEGVLLSADWAWTWGKDWGTSWVSVCQVVEGLVLPVWVGAAAWWSGSLEAWKNKREWGIWCITSRKWNMEALEKLRGPFWEHCVIYSDAVRSFRLPIWDDVSYSSQIL